MRHALQSAALQAQLFAAVLLSLVALRFAATAVVSAVRQNAPALPVLAAPSGGRGQLGLAGDTPEDAGARPDAGPRKPPGRSLRVPLMVHGGTPRSAVYLDGTLLGHSPYIGEVSCKLGEILKIEIVPPAGAPSQHPRQCIQGTLRVEL